MPSRAMARHMAARIIADGGGFGSCPTPHTPNAETVKAMRELREGWRIHLTPEEAQRLVAIDEERRALTREHRRIFDRARKRAERT